MAHSPSPGYEPGNHWVECMRCGSDRRRSEVREDGNKPGLWVCKDNTECWDGYHPGRLVRSTPNKDKPVQPVFQSTDDYEEPDFEDQQVTIPAGTFNTSTL